MDDEDAIRQLASALLRRIGYTAVAVADGAEAITKYDAARRAGQPFDAVVMDLTVPNGMGGADALRELQAMDPGVKAIVCSGYSNDPVMANYREYGFSGVVPKPYNAEDLATALSEMLSTRALSCDALDVG
jgi:CheY-like chemotaxis protein